LRLRARSGAAGDLDRADLDLPVPDVPAGGAAMTAVAAARTSERDATGRAGGRRRGRGLSSALAQLFMIAACVLWILPIGFALYVALRPYSETSKYGYVAMPHHITLSNFQKAWTQSDMLRFFEN